MCDLLRHELINKAHKLHLKVHKDRKLAKMFVDFCLLESDAYIKKMIRILNTQLKKDKK